MEYNSFYGGRRGASFVLVKQYPDIPSMAADFRQGGQFSAVNYDEYVIINTVNKNHPDNGKIFRRGYDYNSGRGISAYQAFREYDPETDTYSDEIINGTAEEYAVAYYKLTPDYDAGGAVYVGTIVGPAGKAPMLTLTTYADAASKQAQTGYDERKSSGEYSPSVDPADLLPGKYIDENDEIAFHDVIEWYCTSIREINDEDTTAYVGFKFPYTVIDYETHQVAPYNASHAYADMSRVDRVDDGTHPFYEKWNIAVPHGVKGDTINNFRVIVPTADDVIYTVGTTTQYPGFQDDVTGGRAILVYDYYNYDSIDNPATITYYIGDYNEITDFTIDEHGTLTVAFTHNDTITYTQLMKWITQITMNKELDGETDHEGRLIVKYNTLDENQEQEYNQWDLNWVRNITFDDEGTVEIDRTVSGITTLNKLIYWIKSVSLDDSQWGDDEGTLTVRFNHNKVDEEEGINEPDVYTVHLKWVNRLTIASNGDVTLHYSGGGQTKSGGHLTWPRQFSISEDGTIKVTNNDSTINLNLEKYLQVIRDMYINNGDIEGNGDQKVYVKYNTDIDPEDPDYYDSFAGHPIGNPLNYVMRMEIDRRTRHLLMLYSDPQKRADVIEAGKNASYDGRDDWLDLGQIYLPSGILIGKNYDPTEVPEMADIDSAKAYLNEQYPDGLTEEDLEGKIVTAGSDDQNKVFYFFDYGDWEWKYLGSTESNPIVVAKDDDSSEDRVKALSIGGVWFIQESFYKFSYELTDVYLDDFIDMIKEGSSYTTDVKAFYNGVSSVEIKMNNINITASAWRASTETDEIAGTISIPTVMGNVSIKIVGY